MGALKIGGINIIVQHEEIVNILFQRDVADISKIIEITKKGLKLDLRIDDSAAMFARKDRNACKGKQYDQYD
jgi:hypothetical protein